MLEINSITEIINSAGLATSGIDLFEYYSPANVTNCVILFPSADPPEIDPDLPGYYKARFQAVIRNVKHQPGIDLAAAISNELTFMNVDTTNVYFKFCRPLYHPRVFRRADSGLIEFSVSFEARYIVK